MTATRLLAAVLAATALAALAHALLLHTLGGAEAIPVLVAAGPGAAEAAAQLGLLMLLRTGLVLGAPAIVAGAAVLAVTAQTSRSARADHSGLKTNG